MGVFKCFKNKTIKVQSCRDQVWWLTIVYASPTTQLRRIPWRDLLQLIVNDSDPWCLAGDFNATLVVDERKSQSGIVAT